MGKYVWMLSMALGLALSFSTYLRYSSTVVAPEEHQQMAKTKGRSAGVH